MHTWIQLAANEVPDKHAAAATQETIAHDPDTVGCGHCRTLARPARRPTQWTLLLTAEMMLALGSSERWTVCSFLFLNNNNNNDTVNGWGSSLDASRHFVSLLRPGSRRVCTLTGFYIA